MSVIRALIAVHFTLYQTTLALVAMVTVLHLLLNYGWMQSTEYGFFTVSGFWIGQGLVTLVNRALGYGGKKRNGSLD